MNENFDDPTSRLHHAAQSAPAAPELSPDIIDGAAARRAPRMVRRGRVARGAGMAVVAVAAVSAGALVVPGLVAPSTPLFTAAGGAGGEAAALSADSKLAFWVNYEYVAGSGLSGSGGRGTVYELVREGAPTAVLRNAADALGLEGDVTEASYSSPEYPSYVVGPEDGSAASLTLTWSGTGSWWYNNPAASPAPVCSFVPVLAEDGSATSESYEECLQPEIPASESLAPSPDEARALAAGLFDATGFDVDASDIRVTADSWQTIASASLTVDGVTTALEASVAWSPLGEISWASGHSVEVVARGQHDTVSPVSAVDRLSDWRWFGAAGPDYAGGAVAFAADSGLARDAAEAADPDAPVSSDGSTGSPAIDPAPSGSGEGTSGDPGTTDPAAPVDPATLEPAPGDDPIDPGLVEPMPEPMPTPETVTVTLEKAEPTLLLLWDADGNAWLVPGYAFENPEQGFWTAVVALIEGVIALPEPVQIEPLPAVID